MDIGGWKKMAIEELNACSVVVGRFNQCLYQQEPIAARIVDLDDLTSLYWAADVAEVLATNTSRMRDALKMNDQIDEDDPWQEPRLLRVTDVTDLWRTIFMSARLERMTMETLAAGYPKFPQTVWKHKPLNSIHDPLYECVINGVVFIEKGNLSEFIYFPVKVMPAPQPPSHGIPKGTSEIPGLLRLELALRRLIQADMQIALWNSAHLRAVMLRAAVRANQPSGDEVFKNDPIPPIPPHNGEDSPKKKPPHDGSPDSE